MVPIVAFVVRLTRGAPSTAGLGGALLTSLTTATIAAGVVGLLGVPLAYVLARGHPAITRPLTALVALPLALPPLMSGLLLLYVLGPYTAAGRLFGGRLTDTRAAVVLAQTFVAAPFLVLTARAAFASVDPALEEMAACLGHGRVARFRRVALRAAMPGVAAGLLLAWLRAFGEFGATVILAYHPYTLPVFTFVQFDATGLPATMLPIATALAAALAVLALVQLPLPRRRARRPPAAAPQRCAPDQAQTLDFSVSKRLGGFSLSVSHSAHTARLALLGVSGAGKTLTLRLLSGVVASDGGHVRAGRRSLDGLATARRRIGYVPQQPALLPRLSVWRQVTFGRHVSDALASWWIERLGLSELEDRYPEELSGGQQRRVALARSLAADPDVLLLDEPFTGLDASLRREAITELRRVQRDAGVSTVIVTHDPEEAAALADEILVIERGAVVQAGSTAALFAAPRTTAVASLLGMRNTAEGVMLDGRRIVSNDVQLSVAETGLAPGTRVLWTVAPERIAIAPHGRYAAIVLDALDLGRARETTLAIEGKLELIARSSRPVQAPCPPETLRVSIAPQDIEVWTPGG